MTSPTDHGESTETSNILLVDDQPTGLKSLELVLEDLGEPIFTAASGQDALAQVLLRDFAVILLDIRMPDMDGFETARLIRSRPRSTHTPIIFVTGADESRENIERVYNVGAVDCLFKPFVPEVLRSKVRFFLELHRKTKALEGAGRRLQQEIAERCRAEDERNRAQADLLQGQKLQATGQLAAGIAHEINNPTGYILSNLNTVQEYLREIGAWIRKDPAGAKIPTREEIDFLLQDFESALADCRTGAERIRTIVQGLREFVHPDEAVLRELDLPRLLDRSVQLCVNDLKYHVTLHRDYQAVEPVTCYPGQIEQVFVNLLVNAAQAMDSGKGEIFLGARAEPGGVLISIRDTGSGIPAANLPRLFLPFFTTKAVGKGTGLGLHVAYKIVRAHGGQMEVRSEEGKGTEFLIHLPLRPPSQNAAAAAAEPAQSPGVSP